MSLARLWVPDQDNDSPESGQRRSHVGFHGDPHPAGAQPCPLIGTRNGCGRGSVAGFREGAPTGASSDRTSARLSFRGTFREPLTWRSCG
jgi:hypothetical protein